MTDRSEDVADLYRLLVANVRDYAIFALDPQGIVLSWNPGAERLKGYTADEIIGRHFSTFYTPEDVAAGKPTHELEVAAREGRVEDEGWRVRKDGSRFWANVIISQIRDAEGRPTGFAKVTRDLTTQRAAAEAAARLQAEQLAHLAAEGRSEHLEELTRQLQDQAAELEAQTEEAQAATEELEIANEELQTTIVEVEEAREAAAAAEQFARGILESITDPFVVQDRDWRFRFMNEAAAAIFRQSVNPGAQSPIGRVLWDLYPELDGTVTGREMRRAAELRVPVTFEAFSPQRGQWLELHCYPLPDGGLATQWKDITGKRRAEESAHFLARATEVLSASLDYTATLQELAQLVVPRLADWCAVEVVGPDGISQQLAVAHVDPEKVRLARELNERYPPDRTATSGAPNVLRTGKPEIYPEIPDALLVAAAVDDEHLRLTRALGLKSAMVVPLLARDRTLGVLTLVSAESGRRYNDDDLTLAMELARRAALAVDNARLHQEALDARALAENANRAKTEFLAVMSHELRTPLNAIAGYADLLRMGLRGTLTPEQDEYVERIQRSEHHLLSLINDVLNFAKLDAGHVEYDMRTVVLDELIRQMEALVLPQVQESGLTYRFDGCAPELSVRADPEKVRQILLNLLSNAVKFTTQGGSVSLACRADDARVYIDVTDTGVGVPADKLDAIFEPFVQLGRGLTERKAGTGLGLAISRDLARAMGGDLQAASTVDAGSTFTLSLRRAQ